MRYNNIQNRLCQPLRERQKGNHMKHHLLKNGDVIQIEKGMKILASIPEKFLYAGRRLSDHNITGKVEVGSAISIPLSENTATSGYESETFDTDIFAGEYVVIGAENTGEGSGYGERTIYPDGYKIICKKLKDGNYDNEGIEISFYQSGCFTAIIPPDKIQPVREMAVTLR